MNRRIREPYVRWCGRGTGDRSPYLIWKPAPHGQRSATKSGAEIFSAAVFSNTASGDRKISLGAWPQSYRRLNFLRVAMNFSRSMKYGLGVIGTSIKYRLNKWKILRSGIYHKPKERKIEVVESTIKTPVDQSIRS